MKKKFIIAFVLLLIQSISLFSQSQKDKADMNEAEPVSESKREISGFSRISVRISADVTIIQGDKEGVEIDASKRVVEAIDISVSGDTLIIGKRDILASVNRAKITVYAINLQSVELTGSGEIISDVIESSELSLIVSGSGDIEIKSLVAETASIKISGSGYVEVEKGDFKTLESVITGSGDIELKGSTDTAKIRISGSGEYKGDDLTATSCEITITGSGDAYINATESIRVQISGSGDVEYKGRPKVDIVNISGSGSVSSK
jgi:hypothetical protein